VDQWCHHDGCLGWFVRGFAGICVRTEKHDSSERFVFFLTHAVCCGGPGVDGVAGAIWFAMVLAGIGLAIMLFGPTGDAQQGSGIASSLRGNMSGLVCSVGFAFYMICVRTDSTRDWGPAMSGYCTMMVGVCAAVTFSKGRPLVPAASNIGFALFHGAVLIVFGTLLFNYGARRVPAVAMAVFAQAETLAVPLLIMAVFAEIPSTTTLMGGAMILAAVLVQAIGEARHSRSVGLGASPLPG
jgi:drug/metabolite transporter, DME family